MGWNSERERLGAYSSLWESVRVAHSEIGKCSNRRIFQMSGESAAAV